MTKIEQYHIAYKNLCSSKELMYEATVAAWPIGMQVVSNKFIHSKHGKPIFCTVIGHRSYQDHGAVILKNNKTGKTHTAWPYFIIGGVPCVEPAKQEQP